MPNTEVSAVEIEYKLETPVEKNLYDYLTSENIYSAYNENNKCGCCCDF